MLLNQQLCVFVVQTCMNHVEKKTSSIMIEHLRRQRPGVGVEPRAVITVDQKPAIGQGVLRFASSPRQFFSARPLHLEQEGRAQISRCASGAGGRTCQRYRLAQQEDRYRVRAANLARLACMVSTADAPARS